MRIYLDNCCYNRPYDDQTSISISLETQAKLVIQEMIRYGKHELVSSYMLEYEVDNSPYISQAEMIRSFIIKNATFYIGQKSMDKVESKAIEIMNTGVKYKDACHVASAILSKCDYFISVDKRLLNYKSTEIKLTNPVEFIRETEGI